MDHCYSREAFASWVCLLAPSAHRVLAPAAAVPLQARPALEALPTLGAAQVTGGPAVNPLVVAQDAGQAEGFTARQAHVLFPLRVNARVVPQSHGVGERLGAEGAAEVSRLVGVFVVQKRARVPVTSITYVACEGPLLFSGTGVGVRVAAARRSATGVVSQLLGGPEGLLALLTFTRSTSQAPPGDRPLFVEFRTNVCQ